MQVHTQWDESQLLHAICILPNTNTKLNITNTTLNITITTPNIITNTCNEKAMQLQVQGHTLSGDFQLLHSSHCLYFSDTNRTLNIITNTCDKKTVQVQVHTISDDFQLLQAVCGTRHNNLRGQSRGVWALDGNLGRCLVIATWGTSKPQNKISVCFTLLGTSGSFGMA